jgi:tRNA pseudouridine38-40 synthase
MKSKYNYLIEVRYLGFRFHGWAKQPGVKTVHGMIDRTINYVLGHDQFKTLGSSRTDARVSALSYFFQLFIEEPIIDEAVFLKSFNENLPADIEVLDIREIDQAFNIIRSPRQKEYRYYFYFGPDKYAFAAPFMSYFPMSLDIDIMTKASREFEGEHDFRRFVTQPSSQTDTIRTILSSELVVNADFNGSMLPPESFVLKLISQGFMRHQIRLMVGQLVLLGAGKISMEKFMASLDEPGNERFDYIAPGSGLMLYKTKLTT